MVVKRDTQTEFARFDTLVGKVLTVPPETLKRRLESDKETYKPKKKKGKATRKPPR